jgi:single-strand DNA-binding protein
MAMFNKVILAGHLTKDPEIRATRGDNVVKCGIAVNNPQKDKPALFIDITLFGKTADNFITYCRKGSGVLIEGSLHFEQWEGQDGKRHSKHSVIAFNFQILDKKQDAAGHGTDTASPAVPERYRHDDNDVPF